MRIILYSFTCSDQPTRSLVTRFASTDTITSTVKHTQNWMWPARAKLPPQQQRFFDCWEQCSTPPLYLPPPPGVLPCYTPHSVSRPEHRIPCVDLPRSIDNHATSGRRCLCRWAALSFSHFALRPDAWRHRRTRSLQQFNSTSYTSMLKK
jgi:hypothetical protein